MLLSFKTKETLIEFLAADRSDTSYILMRGFQRMKHWTAIPIKALTFLYGPNSAGKGSVFDCLTLLRDLHLSDAHSLNDKLARWHRRQENVPLTIGLSLADWRDVWGVHYFDNAIDKYWFSFDEKPSALYQFYLDDMEKEERKRITWLASWQSAAGGTPDMDLYIEDEILARLASLEKKGDDLAGIALNISAFEKHFVKNISGSSPDFRAKCNPQIAELEGGLTQIAKMRGFFWHSLSSLPEIFEIEQGLVDDPNELKGWLVMLFAAPCDRQIGIGAHVGSLRKVPGDQDLRFAFSTGAPSDAADVMRSLGGDGTPEWALLAASELSRQLPDISFGGLCGLDTHLLDEVNRWLALPQFLGTDYRIVSIVTVSVPAYWISTNTFPKSPDDWKKNERSALVRLSLQDNEGRTVKFDDVGTGLSQVIPVLIAALDREYGGVKFFEQPELHLHPKLQTMLCDLFIEAKNQTEKRGTRYLVESHSEHMILRLLRRLRETSSADIQHRRFKLDPHEISILYFEPEGDESYVHLLRVLPDGTFADRWPAGFFEERFEELFNE